MGGVDLQLVAGAACAHQVHILVNSYVDGSLVEYVCMLD